ncbi:MAG: hypothetical protein K6G25_06395 [Bacteroidales bacterium]|nr:hypothetical protein [Bacteroidales bacterium]
MENTRELAKQITTDNIDSMISNVSRSVHDIMKYVQHLSCLDIMTDLPKVMSDLHYWGKSVLYVHPYHTDATHRMQVYAIKFTFSLHDVSVHQVNIKVDYEVIDEDRHDGDCKWFVENYTALVRQILSNGKSSELIYR